MQQTSWMMSDVLSRLNANASMLLIRNLWEYCPEQMFIIRVDGPGKFVVEAMNSTRQVMFKASTSVIGKPIEQLLPQPICQAVIANLSRCVETKTPIRYEESSGHIDRDGVRQREHWQTLLVPISNQEGDITHLFGVSRDLAMLPERHAAAHPDSRELERRVHERTAELVAANEELTYLATHDHLTGTYNRRYLMELAELELRRALRYNQPLTLLMIDIDHFKTINDSQGHLTGDDILRCVARTMLATVRECDLVGRYGGDEFLVLMPETTSSGALEFAERLSQTLRQTNALTISVGIAGLGPDDGFVVDLIHRADALLLQAKRNGRNRIELIA
ncbi:diguanylate cyclase [Billgrantia sp. LNSP4103-1]|uniref:diguanylate cyclase n=1 Tax=Billgrantia sp. LNSP4103-1 TaxID=3410266 RepID=UPI00403FA8D5